MDHIETAVARFSDGHSCSQAVFSAMAEPLGVDHEIAVRIAAGFGGGMGRMAGTCGAVTGAFMALGLKHGGTDSDSKEHTYEVVREFARRFKQRHGTLECKDLLNCDISTPEGREAARQQGLHSSVCSQLVRDAAEIAEDLL